MIKSISGDFCMFPSADTQGWDRMGWNVGRWSCTTELGDKYPDAISCAAGFRSCRGMGDKVAKSIRGCQLGSLWSETNLLISCFVYLHKSVHVLWGSALSYCILICTEIPSSKACCKIDVFGSKFRSKAIKWLVLGNWLSPTSLILRKS